MSTSIVTSKSNALLNVAGQTARSIPDLEHAWLSNELGLTSGNSVSIPDLWKLYLVAFGITEASIVTMMKEWLTEGGYTGSGALQEMWEDKAALLFSVLSPQASGEISVEPINGQGSASFARATVAHVRDHDNVYHEVPANEARIQGARRDAGTYYWKLADGTPIHPVTLKAGQNVFARYDTRVNSTAYEVGDNIIPATGSGPAGGNGYWYQVTAITTGTSGGSPPTFPETIGDTVVDGGITIKNMGHYKLAAYLGEPAGTNSILQSRQFDTIWTQTGTPVLTQDRDGIDGVANTAWTLEDDNGAGFEAISQNRTIPDDSNTNLVSFYILKDSDTSRFPEFQLIFLGGTTQQIKTQMNTQTGETNDRVTSGTVSSTVEDYGLYWRLTLSVLNNGSGNITAQSWLYPAITASLGSTDTTATGSIVVDQAQLELNTSVPSSPIVTTTVAVTRNADADSYDGTNHGEAQGAYYFTVIPSFDSTEVTGIRRLLGSGIGLLYQVSGSSYRTKDSTTTGAITVAYSKGDHLKIGLVYDAAEAKMRININGVWSTEVAYDGAYGTTALNLFLGHIYPMIMSDLVRYDAGYVKGQSIIDTYMT